MRENLSNGSSMEYFSVTTQNEQMPENVKTAIKSVATYRAAIDKLISGGLDASDPAIIGLVTAKDQAFAIVAAYDEAEALKLLGDIDDVITASSGEVREAVNGSKTGMIANVDAIYATLKLTPIKGARFRFTVQYDGENWIEVPNVRSTSSDSEKTAAMIAELDRRESRCARMVERTIKAYSNKAGATFQIVAAIIGVNATAIVEPAKADRTSKDQVGDGTLQLARQLWDKAIGLESEESEESEARAIS